MTLLIKTLLFLLLILSFTVKVYAQKEVAKVPAANNTEKSFSARNLISFYPLDLIISQMSVGFERKISRYASARVIGTFGMAEANNFYYIREMSVAGIELQYRRYVSKNLPRYSVLKGFYMAPFAYIKHIQYDDEYNGWNSTGPV